MGILEKEIKAKDKRKNIQKIILGTIFTAGMLGVMVVAPNVLSVIRQLEKGSKRKKNLKYSINESFTRLKEKGLIEIVEINGKKVARVTSKGEDKLDFLERHSFKLKLQNSVWVYPYDCEDFISLLKADFKIGKDVLYIIVEKLENDWHLRKFFNLPNSSGRKS